ncbi:DUF4230 domain-containing protein [Sphingoaurantiacus capsulatus]|uniref:DUF4230 domain-containing protein n=1 Tax=Sphingoaurantiacus capsulatus TaxID=1771310 RepID=A0ABV7XD69_9SPHN
MKRAVLILVTLALGLAIGGIAALNWRTDSAPNITSIAQSSLQAVQAQNRLTAFAARFTVAVTSATQRLGLSARKTIIVPGLVRYELDWAKVQASDLVWDAATKRLTVTLPPVEISEPAVDLAQLQEYEDGKLLMALGNAETALDAANRAKLRAALMKEAQAPTLMKLARDATRAAVERTFELPLNAAGVDADVVVRFRDEAGQAM